MDGSEFDGLARTLAKSRRSLLGGGLVVAAGWLGTSGAGAKKRRKKKRKPKNSKPNGYGCLNVGASCRSEGQCCSGTCEGKKGRRKCVAHDVAICQVDSDVCSGGQAVLCGTNNPLCACTLTTGNAPFCGDYAGFPGETLCRDCSQDTDCEAEFGPGAACVIYSRLCAEICPDTGTACVPACKNVEL
jgi:hypothetical protein